VHATQFAQHAFRSAEVMASHPVIGPVYRASTELSLPHFGSTLLLTAPDSDAARVAVTFGDRSFHLGLAQLCLGMVAALGAAQIDSVLEFRDRFGIADPAAAEAAARGLERIASSRDRCSMTTEEVDGQPRFVISNWRRNPGGAPQRILL
jgi:hypothetical protein